MTAELAKHFDEATLRPKLAKYLSAPVIHTACHQIGEHLVGLIYVAPNPYGWCVIHTAGEYQYRGTWSKWRSRFLSRRLESLTDEPRPGRPRVIGDDQAEEVITKTLEQVPGQDTHWSTRSMAGPAGSQF